MSEPRGVVFPRTGAERSTSAFGREVVASAMEAADPVGATAARADTGWRRGYPTHFRRMVEVALADPQAPVGMARRGLTEVGERFCWRDPDLPEGADDQPLTAAFCSPGRSLDVATVEGIGEHERHLTVPFHGRRLAGDDLRRRLDTWVDGGVMEPGARAAVLEVLAHPEWLDLSDLTFVVLGAAAEMGPLRSLLRWGATVAALDLPREDLWQRVLLDARRGAGRLLLPVAPGHADDDRLERHAGADLLHDLSGVAGWADRLPGRLVLGNYVYADGAVNLRLAGATDALGERLQDQRGDVALAYLATPTDVFVAPQEAITASGSAYENARYSTVLRTPLRTLSGGRLLRRQYAPGATTGVSDSVVPQQGPNYLLAKRIHRWRATAAAADGRLVSMTVAPPTRTRSVTKNRALAAAYAGAHRFGVEVFDPSTANTLMAALLVHDLRTGGVAARPGAPLEAEGLTAVHGGLWRTGYDPRSALGIAALMGLGAARH